MNKEVDFKTKWLPIFLMAVGLVVVYKLLDNFSAVMAGIGSFVKTISPFLVSILIVYFLYRPCKFLEENYKKSKVDWIAKRARGLSIFVVYLILVLLIFCFIMFVSPILVESLFDLIGNVPLYYNNILDFINNLPENNLEIKENLTIFANNALNVMLDPVRIEQVAKGIIGLANGVFNIVISLIVSLYILLDRENIFKFFNNLASSIFTEKQHSKIKKYLHQVNRVIFTFISSKGIDSIINFVVVTTILLLFNVKYALLLGLIAGILNFIPYLGSLIAVILITLLTVLTADLNLAFKVLIALMIFQQLDGNYIEPKLMGNSLKISPILVIFAVLVAGRYFGIAGMFLAVPIVAIAKEVLFEYMNSNNRDKLKVK